MNTKTPTGLLAVGISVLLFASCLGLFAVISGSTKVAPGRSTDRSTSESVTVDWVDFADNPSKYKGKTITLPLTVDQAYSIQDPDGGPAWFRTDGRHQISVTIPKGLQVPNALQDEKVTVTFYCCGQLTNTENVAKKIERRGDGRR